MILLLLLLFCILLLILRFLVKLAVLQRKLSQLPTAPGCHWFFGHTHLVWQIMKRQQCVFTNAVRLFVQEVHTKTAPEMSSRGIFKIFMGPVPVVVLSSPETANFVFKKTNLPKSFFVYNMSRLLIKGLVNINGLEFKYHKNILAPCLGSGNYIEIAGVKAHETMNYLSLQSLYQNNFVVDDIRIPTTKFAEACMWDAAGILQEDNYFSDENIHERWQNFLNIEAYVSGIDLLPWHHFRHLINYNSAGRKLREPITRWTDVAKKPVERVKESFDRLPNMSFIRALLEEHSRCPDIFTLETVIEEVKTILAGGVKTSSNLVTWTLHQIGHRPEIQDKIIEEVARVFEGKPLDYIPNNEDYTRLEYTKSVIKEGMRLYTNGALIGREAHEDILIPKDCVELNNNSKEYFVLPKGTEIAISIESINTNPRFWKNPFNFDPERHVLKEEGHQFAFCTFAAGQRGCPGQKIAKIESLAFITRVFREYRIESLDPLASLRLELFLTLNVTDPVSLKLTRLRPD